MRRIKVRNGLAREFPELNHLRVDRYFMVCYY